MPAKNRIKVYSNDSYYHLFNRGLDGREIYRDDEDMNVFERILAGYIEKEAHGYYKKAIAKRLDAMYLGDEVKIIAYCLMPDHFHLLVWQRQKEGVTKLMRRVNTAYVMYFNKKYNRQGTLFENIYRAIKVQGRGEELKTRLLHLTRLIHLNPVTKTERRIGPVVTVTGSRPEDYTHSSYTHYIGTIHRNWIHELPFLPSVESYRQFVEQPQKESLEVLNGLLLD